MSAAAGAQAASRKRRRTPPAAAAATAPQQDEMFWYYGDSDEDATASTETTNSRSYSYGTAAEGSTGREASTEPDYIELLDSDGEDEDLAAADLQNDADVDVIEILSSDLEDDDDVLLVEETEGADVTPPAKKPRHHVLDLCGSQVKTYEEEAPTQRELYQMYIDGSHRQHWPKQIQMSAGGFCLHPAGSWFNFSCLLLGGKPTSTRAELGAIYIGCQRLINAVEGGRMNTAGSEVHMHTDCQSAANVLKRLNAKVAPKLAPLIKGIKVLLKRLKLHLPVRLKWVKGHQTGDGEHRRGNDEAHRRAQPHSLTSCEVLPTAGTGHDKAAAAAAWNQLLQMRGKSKGQQHRQLQVQQQQNQQQQQQNQQQRQAMTWQQLLEQQQQEQQEQQPKQWDPQEQRQQREQRKQRQQRREQQRQAQLEARMQAAAARAAAHMQRQQQMKRKGKKARRQEQQTAGQRAAARQQQRTAVQQLQEQQQPQQQVRPLVWRAAQQQQQQQQPLLQQQVRPMVRCAPQQAPPPQQQHAGLPPYGWPGAGRLQQPPPPPPLPSAAAAAAAATAWPPVAPHPMQPQPLVAAAPAQPVTFATLLMPVGVVALPSPVPAAHPQPATAPPPFYDQALPPAAAAPAAAVAAAAKVALPDSPVRLEPAAAAAAPKSTSEVICIDC